MLLLLLLLLREASHLLLLALALRLWGSGIPQGLEPGVWGSGMRPPWALREQEQVMWAMQSSMLGDVQGLADTVSEWAVTGVTKLKYIHGVRLVKLPEPGARWSAPSTGSTRTVIAKAGRWWPRA